jgi:peptidoglycan/LPS O-acetylase OafA/YrhL
MMNMMGSRLGYVPALDGVRGLAIISVVGFHAYGWPHSGTSGVDLFFVLSGFLITTLLLEEHAGRGRISLRAFYARRVRRLAPALVVMLIGVLVLTAAKGHALYGLVCVAQGGFYVGNFLAAFWPHVLGDTNPARALWSLAEEEQFYLVWPIALIFALRRASLGAIERVVWLLIVAVAGLTVYKFLAGAPWTRTYYGPDTRSFDLLVGVGAALAVRKTPAELVERWLAPVGLLGFAAAAAYFNGGARYVESMVPVGFASLLLVIGVVAHPQTLTARLLSVRPLVYVGKISYSLYLLHGLILWTFDFKHQPLAIAISVALASLSYRYVERPFRVRRRRPDPQLPQSAIAAA